MDFKHTYRSLLVSLLACSSWQLLANDASTITDDMLPPEYFDLEVVDLNSVIGKPGEAPAVTTAKCRGGHRIGDALGRSFIEKIQPSCDELLFPLGAGVDNEWSVPQLTYEKISDAATMCSYVGFSTAFEQTVFNTAKNCAKVIDDSAKLASQLEYNRCYIAASEVSVRLKVKFGKGSGFITGEYAVIPRDSDAWDEYLQSLVTIINNDGSTSKSALLQLACNLGTSHAIRKQEPVNFFE
jgi:hypothetical protein